MYMFGHKWSSNDKVNDNDSHPESDRFADAKHVHQKFFAPPERYQLRVLKEVMGRVERAVMTWGSDYDVCFLSRFSIQHVTSLFLAAKSNFGYMAFI